MAWIILPTDDAPARGLGGKARALAALSRAGLPIPDWFAVRSGACLQSLGKAGQDQLASAFDTSAIQALLAKAVPAPALLVELKSALAKLCPPDAFVAVRSSAADEDGVAHSFAGQLESYLFVPRDRVAEKVAAVWRSGFSSRILAYRRQHSLPLVPVPPAVLVQRMVNADAAGVAFSADPVSGRRGVAVVSAVFGLGTALVSGEADADTWRVERSGKIIETRIAEKTLAHRPAPDAPEGVRTESLSAERARQPVLSEEQVRSVAALARRCAAHFGRPQDIEWAIEGGRLYLLQSRPITSLAAMADPDGVLNIWDNSNIAESYGGITTPLTYSFARRAYEEVYRQFCHLMAVPSARIANNAPVFRCMIGLVQGRVYYNLLNWYRVLALLPGFTVNRRFMEQMMGVKEGLPEELVRGIHRATMVDRIKDALALGVTVAGLLVNHFTLRSRNRKFYARLDQALRAPDPPLDQARPDELAVYYQDLERQLLTRWDAPLVNDFFAMIFYGVLRKLARKWCGDADGTLQNNLLCGQGGMISAEPVRRLRELAAIAARHPALASSLATAPLASILPELEKVPEFASSWHQYLDQFGDRCLDELKLESPTLHDDPTLLLRSVGHLALQSTHQTDPAPSPPSPHEVGRGPGRGVPSLSTPQAPLPTSPSSNTTSVGGARIDLQLRRQAEARIERALRYRLLRRLVFGWVLRHTRARVRDRENLRFERTRLFGRVRRIFVALGCELSARNLIESPADVFYLGLEEILGCCDGTGTTADLQGLVALRRAEFARYAAIEPPADRFETHGPINHGNIFRPPAAETPAPESGDNWQGIGCCPGIVRGRVRVVTDPRRAILQPGEILVAERTDPGWIFLFASAAGLLVERGSLLSHSAIVSREMGLPAIVGLPVITRHLKDGDQIEMDGSTGQIRRIPNP